MMSLIASCHLVVGKWNVQMPPKALFSAPEHAMEWLPWIDDAPTPTTATAGSGKKEGDISDKAGQRYERMSILHHIHTDIQSLLRYRYRDFWGEVVHGNGSLHQFLDSYLYYHRRRLGQRSDKKVNSNSVRRATPTNNDDDTSILDEDQLQYGISRGVLMLIYRMATSREGDTGIDATTHGNLIYDNYVCLPQPPQ
jgi:hypothetical protein